MKTMRKTALFFITLILIIPACDPPGENKYDPKSDNYKAYNVIYDANGADSGEVPVDETDYVPGRTVIVLGNTGNLTIKTQNGISLLFAGWNTADNGSGVDYDATGSDSFTMGTADVTLYAKWSALRCPGPAGGWIFYDKGSYSNGWRYLEAAPASTEWTSKQWGSYGTEISGTGTGIGVGKANTTAIVTWLNNNVDDTYGDVTNKADRAAYLCDALIVGGKEDWFLPSKDELNQMYVNLKAYGVGGFAGNPGNGYWSSSEFVASHAWGQLFDIGYQFEPPKGNVYYVRAIRAF